MAIRRKMDKNFPEDLVEHIISFACDRRGYNNIKCYKIKKKNAYNMKRIFVELWQFIYWNRKNFDNLKPNKYQKRKYKIFKESLKYGKPKIVYHIGLYCRLSQELSTMDDYYKNIDDYNYLENYYRHIGLVS